MKIKLALLFFFAFILRLILIPVAHHGDLNNNISWGEELLERGFDGYYGSADSDDWPYSAPNQPPFYILIYGGLIWVFKAVRDFGWWLNTAVGIFPSSFIWWWDRWGIEYLVKFPGIFADLGIGWLIYRYFKGDLGDKVNRKSEKKANLLAAIWLFNPITWYNSGVWGQTDSLVNFLGLLAILGLLGVFGELGKLGRLGWFCIWFTLAFLYKGSLGIFIPILAIVVLKQGFQLKEYLLATCYILLTIFIISIWFHPYSDFPIWFVDLFQSRILPGEIGYLTANAFNFWWLVDSGKVLDSTLYFGIPARVWGLVGGIGGIGSVGWWLAKKKTKDIRIFLSLSVVSLVAFIFMTRMHERYMYPFFPYATLLLGLIPHLWILYIVLSLTYLANMYHLFFAPSIPFIETLYSIEWFAQMLAVINIVGFFYLLRHLRKAQI